MNVFLRVRQLRPDIRCLDSTRPRNASGIGCPRRRDDRIEMLFAAVRESLVVAPATAAIAYDRAHTTIAPRTRMSGLEHKASRKSDWRPKNLRDGDMDIRAPDQRYNPYRIFSREQWAELRNETPMTLEPGEFSQLRSMHDRLDLCVPKTISGFIR